jgi:hypothetical protein
MNNIVEDLISFLSDKDMCLLKVGVRKNFKKIEIYGTIVEDYTHAHTIYETMIKKISDFLFEKETESGVFPVYNEYLEKYNLIPKMINFGLYDVNIKNIMQYYLEQEFRKRFNK